MRGAALLLCTLAAPSAWSEPVADRPGAVHEVTGYVVKRYTPPPCPTGALCKPTMSPNIVVSENRQPIDSYEQLAPRDVIVFCDRPDELTLAARYALRVQVLQQHTTNRGLHDLKLIEFHPAP